MLVEVLCLNHVAACSGLAGKRHVPFMALAVGSATWTLIAVLHSRSVGGSLTGPSGPILHCLFQRAATPSGGGLAALTNTLTAPGAEELLPAHQTLARSALDGSVGCWLLIAVVHDFLLHLDCLDLFDRRPTGAVATQLADRAPITGWSGGWQRRCPLLAALGIESLCPAPAGRLGQYLDTRYSPDDDPGNNATAPASTKSEDKRCLSLAPDPSATSPRVV